jgi:hypothetical protein
VATSSINAQGVFHKVSKQTMFTRSDLFFKCGYKVNSIKNNVAVGTALAVAVGLSVADEITVTAAVLLVKMLMVMHLLNTPRHCSSCNCLSDLFQLLLLLHV